MAGAKAAPHKGSKDPTQGDDGWRLERAVYKPRREESEANDTEQVEAFRFKVDWEWLKRLILNTVLSAATQLRHKRALQLTCPLIFSQMQALQFKVDWERLRRKKYLHHELLLDKVQALQFKVDWERLRRKKYLHYELLYDKDMERSGSSSPREASDDTDEEAEERRKREEQLLPVLLKETEKVLSRFRSIPTIPSLFRGSGTPK
eukprot:gene7567-720_t